MPRNPSLIIYLEMINPDLALSPDLDLPTTDLL